MAEETRPAYYVTTLDRVGLAILSGGLLTGVIAMLLVVAGGERAFAALLLAWIGGAVLSAFGIVAVMGPAWLVLHRHGHRGPGVAAAVAGLSSLAVFILNQTLGTDGDRYRIASAIGTSLMVALVAAAIGAAMQRVAYRRLL